METAPPVPLARAGVSTAAVAWLCLEMMASAPDCAVMRASMLIFVWLPSTLVYLTCRSETSSPSSFGAVVGVGTTSLSRRAYVSGDRNSLIVRLAHLRGVLSSDAFNSLASSSEVYLPAC